MDCHMRCAHLCFVQRKFGEFYIVVSLLSQPFQHARWPCDHPRVVLAESLPLLHMRESPRLGCFRARFIIAFQNDSAKTKIFDETDKT